MVVITANPIIVIILWLNFSWQQLLEMNPKGGQGNQSKRALCYDWSEQVFKDWIFMFFIKVSLSKNVDQSFVIMTF